MYIRIYTTFDTFTDTEAGPKLVDPNAEPKFTFGKSGKKAAAPVPKAPPAPPPLPPPYPDFVSENSEY